MHLSRINNELRLLRDKNQYSTVDPQTKRRKEKQVVQVLFNGKCNSASAQDLFNYVFRFDTMLSFNNSIFESNTRWENNQINVCTTLFWKTVNVRNDMYFRTKFISFSYNLKLFKFIKLITLSPSNFIKSFAY